MKLVTFKYKDLLNILDETRQVAQCATARESTTLYADHKDSTECCITLLQIVEQGSTGNHLLQIQDSLESQ